MDKFKEQNEHWSMDIEAWVWVESLTVTVLWVQKKQIHADLRMQFC